ncbi:MAG: hypothetical protein ACOCU3_00320 [bacterium]
MTASKRLPENQIDNIGITPDLNIPFPPTEQLYDKLDDWIYLVKKSFRVINYRGRTEKINAEYLIRLNHFFLLTLCDKPALTRLRARNIAEYGS